jgi:hypothetical protein
MTGEDAVRPRASAATAVSAVVGLCWAVAATIVTIGLSALSSRLPKSLWILLPLEKNVPPAQNTFEYSTHDVLVGGWSVCAIAILIAVIGLILRARCPAFTVIAAVLIALWVSESSFAVAVAVYHQRDITEVASRVAVADYLNSTFFLGYALALGVGLLSAVYLPLHLTMLARRRGMRGRSDAASRDEISEEEN